MPRRIGRLLVQVLPIDEIKQVVVGAAIFPIVCPPHLIDYSYSPGRWGMESRSTWKSVSQPALAR
jgi:hypothetical protein